MTCSNSTITQTLLALLLVALSACYPHRGSPRDSAPQELLVEAEAACQRFDRRAYDTLLKRLLRTYPTAQEREEATRMLADATACTHSPAPDSTEPERRDVEIDTKIEHTIPDVGFQADAEKPTSAL